MFVVFFKQKTAYEMRISDWSSDVCSSDLRSERRDYRSLCPARRLHGFLHLCRHAPAGTRGAAARSRTGHRHLRFSGGAAHVETNALILAVAPASSAPKGLRHVGRLWLFQQADSPCAGPHAPDGGMLSDRSEERRVGNACVSKWKARGSR